MVGLPPLPPGATLEPSAAPPAAIPSLAAPKAKRRDPLDVLKAEGFEFTNGFRTPADTQRIAEQGYKPAPSSAHLDGDGVDLRHPKLSPSQQSARLRELFGDWEGFDVRDEGHHTHLRLPGWGAAPGTPGTPASGLPALPEGASLYQRGSLEATPPMADKAARIATLDFGLARGDMTPEQHRQFVAEVKSGRSLTDRPADLVDAGGVILFRDEQPEAPATKLSPDDEAAFLEFVRRGDVAGARRFRERKGVFGTDNLDEVVAALKEGARLPDAVQYNLPEAIQSDGAAGAFARGAGDPFNVLDEMGAAVDTLGFTPGRESVWNSDRGFGDILYSNIDANRSILDADARDHWKSRLGGQLLTSVVLPIGAGARTPAALARVGGAEGFAAGFGAGEGNPLQRAPHALLGAGVGAGGGFALGKLVEAGAPLVRKAFGRASAADPSDVTSAVARESAFETVPVVNDAVQNVGPTPAAKTQPRGGVVADERMAAMASGIETPMLTGPAARERDYINVADLPPLPPGAALIDDAPLGKVRPMGQQASAEEIAEAARRIEPRDVVPIPDNVVRSVDELETSFKELEAPRIGRTPRKPGNVLAHVKDWVRAETNAKGMPVRIDAEDAIDKGVPAEYIYMNPNTADRSRLRLRNPSVFGTRYGSMSGTQQHLRSLDALDLDPVTWGFDNAAAARLEPEDIGDLLRRGFEGDESALNRSDPAFGPWNEYQARAADRAEFDGRFPDGPPVERVGEPATMDDLANLEPPVTAYEDLPNVGGKVANINLAHVETRADIRRLLQNVETKFGGFDAARRGKVSQGETAQLASELGMTPDDLLKRRKGQALNAEQALAARQLLAKSGDEVTALAKRIADGPSDEERAAFARAIVRHAAIQEQVSGATAEAGRALAQFKMAARSKAVSGSIHKTIIDGMGGEARLEDVAAGILDLQQQGADPGAVNRFALDALKPTKTDYLVEYYYNALLSGVSTHIVNSVSNLATQLTQIPEYGAAAALGGVRAMMAKVAGKQAAERVLFSEVGARALGTMQGTKEGLLAFAKVMRTGDPIDPMTKVETRRHKAIPGVAGSIIRTPTRLLMAEDELFKAMARRSSVAGLAVRKAKDEGLSGEPAKRRIAELTAAPTDDMVKQSFDFARYLTFQTPLGSIGQMGIAATNKAPLLKLVVPFIRTPVNLFKFSLERLPVAQLALRRVREDYKAGGARRDLAVARATFGAGVGALVATYAAQGKVTGRGPDDAGTRRLLMASGWQPYSIKIGDKWFSYSRTDPFASIIGVAADLATFKSNMAPGKLEEAHMELFNSILSQIQSKTWLSGVSDLVEAIDDPERFLASYVSRVAGSFIPTVVAHAAASTDPVMRDTKATGSNILAGESILNRMQSRIPGLSDSLPAMRDAWGREIRKEGSPAYRFLSPFYMKTDEKDPISKALLDAGAGMGKPKRTISDGMGGERDLSDAEFGQYQIVAGRYIREDIEDVIADPEWSQLDPAQQRKEIKRIVTVARKDAREELFSDPGEPEALPAVDPSALPPLPAGAALLPN